MYNLERIEETKIRLNIEVSGEEFKTAKESILKELKEVKIDGFRKGHAPIDVIEKTFENKIKEELLRTVVSSELHKSIVDNNFEIISETELISFETTTDKVNAVVEFEIMPEFELAQYKGLGVELEVKEVTEDRINESLESVAKRQKKIETLEKEVASDNDLVNINFEGFVDGVAFEGGKAEGFDLLLGSKSFIDTFEDQIVGKKVGEEFDVNVTFPEEYHAENLKGAKAVFKVKLNAIKKEVIPAIDDELAKLNGYDTLEDYKKVLKAELENANEKEAENRKYEKIAEKITEETTINISSKMKEAEKNNQIARMEADLANNGVTLDKYLEIISKEKEVFESEMEQRAEKIIKFNFILSKIAKAENIEVTREDVKGELVKLASMYSMTEEQLVSELTKANLYENYMNQISSQIFMNKMKEFLVNNN